MQGHVAGRGGGRLRSPCFTGKFMSRKKASLPSVGDFLSAKWDEARLKSSLSIKTRGRGKKNERIDDKDNDNVINFLLVSSVDRNLCKTCQRSINFSPRRKRKTLREVGVNWGKNNGTTINSSSSNEFGDRFFYDSLASLVFVPQIGGEFSISS